MVLDLNLHKTCQKQNGKVLATVECQSGYKHSNSSDSLEKHRCRLPKNSLKGIVFIPATVMAKDLFL